MTRLYHLYVTCMCVASAVIDCLVILSAQRRFHVGERSHELIQNEATTSRLTKQGRLDMADVVIMMTPVNQARVNSMIGEPDRPRRCFLLLLGMLMKQHVSGTFFNEICACVLNCRMKRIIGGHVAS